MGPGKDKYQRNFQMTGISDIQNIHEICRVI